jgi:hypothetical protein
LFEYNYPGSSENIVFWFGRARYIHLSPPLPRLPSSNDLKPVQITLRQLGKLSEQLYEDPTSRTQFRDDGGDLESIFFSKMLYRRIRMKGDGDPTRHVVRYVLPLDETKVVDIEYSLYYKGSKDKVRNLVDTTKCGCLL